MHTFSRAKEFYLKHEVLCSAIFFIGGFLFDVMTLSEPDDFLTITQQVVYLVLLVFLLFMETRVDILGKKVPRWVMKYWEFRHLIIHFLFGSLLSVYSLYYFQSSSFTTSLIFLLIIFTLLVLNEFPQVQALGLRMRWLLWTLCAFSFYSTVVPIFLRRLGLLSFALALLLTLLSLLMIYFYSVKRANEQKNLILKNMWTAAIVPLVFLLAYLFKVLPPVPLALKDIGVYHKIEKDPARGIYRLSQERHWLKFWQKGDQDFYARPGESIYVFVAIYSPAQFKDAVYINWSYKDPRQGWVSWQRIPLAISGGRSEGYRGYTYKANYDMGEWRAIVESSDGREMGRIQFTVEATSEPAVYTIIEK